MELALVGRLFAACIVIALVLGVVQMLAARLGRSRMATGVGVGGRLVTLVETTYLPGAASLHVVRVAERYYVLGRSGTAISTVCELPSGDVERWLDARARTTSNAVEPILHFANRFRRRRS